MNSFLSQRSTARRVESLGAHITDLESENDGNKKFFQEDGRTIRNKPLNYNSRIPNHDVRMKSSATSTTNFKKDS